MNIDLFSGKSFSKRLKELQLNDLSKEDNKKILKWLNIKKAAVINLYNGKEIINSLSCAELFPLFNETKMRIGTLTLNNFTISTVEYYDEYGCYRYYISNEDYKKLGIKETNKSNWFII